MYQGIALILQGKNEDGIAVLTRGISDYLATGTHSSLGWYLSRLAIGYAQAGDIDRALETIQDAIGAAPDETMHLPELYRLRADFKLAKGNPEDVETIVKDYRQAIALSRHFGALSQELRAATRLGRLLYARGRSDEAYTLLAPIYARFSEGFDTLDLIEARMFLNELSVSLPVKSI
jgi:predicted ATPase